MSVLPEFFGRARSPPWVRRWKPKVCNRPAHVAHHACLWRRPNEASPAVPTARPAAHADYWAAGHFLAIAMRFASGFVSGLMPTPTSRMPSP